MASGLVHVNPSDPHSGTNQKPRESRCAEGEGTVTTASLPRADVLLTHDGPQAMPTVWRRVVWERWGFRREGLSQEVNAACVSHCVFEANVLT